AGFPRKAARAGSERVMARIGEGMPVAHRKAQVFGHGLAADALVRVVDLEGQRIVRLHPLKGNAANPWKVLASSDERGAHAVCPVRVRKRIARRRSAGARR